MRQKLIIGFSLLLLVAVLILIVIDFFGKKEEFQTNSYKYDIENFKQNDTSLTCFKVITKIKPDLPELNAIAVDHNFNIYIASNDEVQVLDSSFQKINSFKTDSIIHCMTIDNDGKIYLGIGNRVVVFDKTGKLLKKWYPYSDNGYITSLIVKGNDIYVADAGNRLLLKYDIEGNLAGTIGKKDKEKGIEGFVIPSTYFDVALGQDSEIWVVNPGKHKLQQYSDYGDLLTSWGSTSMEPEGFSGCCNPVHFAILPDGRFVTYEKGLDRIKIHGRTGKFECIVAGSSDFNAEAINVCTIGALVHDMAVDNRGSVYIIDVMKVVRVFQRK